MNTFALLAGRVVTCDPLRRTVENPLGAISEGGVLVEGSAIRRVGGRSEILGATAGAPVLLDAPDAVLTPGLCDAHTHAAFVGSRHHEYVARLLGKTYQDIAGGGGGILASMHAVRAATLDELTCELRARLGRMAALGVTTVEVKSGYGLDAANETKQLAAIAEAGKSANLPRLVPTYLALHALPPESAARRQDYVADAVRRVRAFADARLVAFVDAYVDELAFSVEEAELVAHAAQTAGLGVRLHVGQFADVGGAELAARLGASSADHLEHVGRRDLEALAAAGTRAVLLPVASFTLGQAPPPISELRRAGVKMVVASDANPGTAPTESLPLALALAVRTYGLTPDEALLGATSEAAHALGLGDRVGAIAPGFEADLALWDLPHEYAIVEPWGTSKVRLTMRAGQVLTPA